MSKYVGEVVDDNFGKEVLESGRPVLVDFWASWCKPCLALAPTVEALAEKYEGTLRVAKLDVDANPSVAARYGIKGLPTLILFGGGRELERVVGAASKDAISRVIDRHLVAAGA